MPSDWTVSVPLLSCLSSLEPRGSHCRSQGHIVLVRRWTLQGCIEDEVRRRTPTAYRVLPSTVDAGSISVTLETGLCRRQGGQRY